MCYLDSWQQSHKSILIPSWFEEGLAEEQSDLHLWCVGVSVGDYALG